jgi:hypothetical protein
MLLVAAVVFLLPAGGRCEELPLTRVGQVLIVGNEKTSLRPILRCLHLYPVQVFTAADLRQAEKNLFRLGRFVGNPTVVVLHNPDDPECEFKDILITVVEKEGTNFYDVIYDWLGDWGTLRDVNSRAMTTHLCVLFFYNACRP